MSTTSAIIFARESSLGVDELRELLISSGLGATRPVHDEDRLGQMLAQANLIVTARSDEPRQRLIGVARAITDFSWCCYLAELAIREEAKGLGIGQRLLAAVKAEVGPAVSLILVSVTDAVGFYKRAGMDRIADAFWYRSPGYCSVRRTKAVNARRAEGGTCASLWSSTGTES